MTARAAAPAIGVVVLLLVGVTLGSAVAAGAEAVAEATETDQIGGGGPADPDGMVALSLRLDGDEVALTHEAGPTLRMDDVRLVVKINGERLDHQPPVPFFAAEGFRGGPTGPFNVASDGRWSAGESGAFRIAATNDPTLSPGDVVSVAVYADGRRVGQVRGIAG
ncbi:type IV pilin [Halobellus ordinarius]|uniref:type IV pilin n=1 Tax=Halobellus ordinarius TaxID=3075120 RepID=UPI00288075B2|nr:type IV pilin [Halobellus sp. ZY16]